MTTAPAALAAVMALLGSASPLPRPDLPLILAQAEAPRLFHGIGTVTATEPAGTLTINHQPIEGLMPAMEMMFKLNPPTLARGIKPGDRVDFAVEGRTYVITAAKLLERAK